jgi:putative oxidoreductase
MSASLLILRLVLGTAMAAHGAQKLFGWFGGYGLKGTGGYMESLGFRPGVRFALAAGLTEFAGGLLFATGLLGPIGPALMLSVMLVAILTVHKSHGFFAMTNGIELPVLYITGALAVAFTGPGRFSLDHVLGLSGYFDQTIVWVALVAGVLGALANLSVRHLPEPVSKTA